MSLTPEQFNKLATKDEFNDLKTEVREVKNDVRRILTGVDGLAKKLDDIEHITNYKFMCKYTNATF